MHIEKHSLKVYCVPEEVVRFCFYCESGDIVNDQKCMRNIEKKSGLTRKFPNVLVFGTQIYQIYLFLKTYINEIKVGQ